MADKHFKKIKNLINLNKQKLSEIQNNQVKSEKMQSFNEIQSYQETENLGKETVDLNINELAALAEWGKETRNLSSPTLGYIQAVLEGIPKEPTQKQIKEINDAFEKFKELGLEAPEPLADFDGNIESSMSSSEAFYEERMDFDDQDDRINKETYFSRDDRLEIPAFLRMQASASLDNSEEDQISLLIRKLESLQDFSKDIDDIMILAYVDGHLDKEQANNIEFLIDVDDDFREEIELLKISNSVFGYIEDDYKELEPSVLEEWIETENTAKKNYEVLAKDTLKNQSLLSKIKDFITFRPLDLSFAAITPMFIGAGLLYGTNSTIVASNPAIIQLSNLSFDSKIYLEGIETTFPGSSALISRGESVMRYNKIRLMPDCSLPEFKLDPKIFNKQFQIMVTNPKTKKTFQFTDNDKLLSGNKIKFYFDYNDKGTIYIDNVLPSNEGLRIQETEEDTPCKTENFLISDYKVNTRSKIGDTYSINPPWRKERIIIFFKDDKSEEKYPIGLLNYQPTTLEIFDKRLMSLEWEKKKNVQELERNGLYKLYSNVLKKHYMRQI